MVQIIVLGVIAGIAAALLLASPISGSHLSLLLVSIASLPILIVGIGWSHVAGLLAAVVAPTAIAVAALASATPAASLAGALFITILLGVGLPAWWLSYLALLARPNALARPPALVRPAAPPADSLPTGQDAMADSLEWYPVGRIVVWSAILATGVVTLTLLTIGSDAETIRSGLKRLFEEALRLQAGTPRDAPLELPAVANVPRFLNFIAIMVPPTAAVIGTITSLLNLWLAARVVMVSGRLKRPWPDLAAIAFPPAVAAILMATILGTFLPGLVGIIAGLFTATLLTAYAILGFAVLHKITGGIRARGFVLASAYAAVCVFGWPVLVMTVLGVADSVLDVRGRLAARRRPPNNVV